MKRYLKLILCIFVSMEMFLNFSVDAKGSSAARLYEKIDFNTDGSAVLDAPFLDEGAFSEMVDSLNFSFNGVGVVVSDDVKLDRGLTLHPNRDNVSSFILINGNVRLDLNGNFITQLPSGEISEYAAIIVPQNSHLTIVDSSQDGTGAINGVSCAISVVGGELTTDGATITTQTGQDYEQETCIKVSNSGKAVINGGKIMCNGIADDEFDLSTQSSGIRVDSLSEVEISGGIFNFDVGDYLSEIYKINEQNGWYCVDINIPHVSGNSDELTVSVSAECDENKQKVLKYVAYADCNAKNITAVQLDISELIKTASNLENCPLVEISTGFCKATLDEKLIKKINKSFINKKIIFSVVKNTDLKPELVEKLINAKYEISCSLSDETGETILPELAFPLEIYRGNVSSQTSTRIYIINGNSVIQRPSEVENGMIRFETKCNETLVISEGTVITISGRTLDLQGTISLVFYANLEGVETSKAKMLFWTSPQEDYTEETAERSVSYTGRDSNGYKFEYKNISSKDMNKKIYARLVAKDINGSTVYGAIPKEGYGVVSYAENMMKNSELKPLLVKMLNYGAAAQEYFDSGDVLSNHILSDSEKVMDMTKIYRSDAKTISEDNKNGNASYRLVGKTLTLDGDISINYYVSGNEKVDEIGMLFWTEEAFESNKVHILGNQSRVVKNYTSNGQYRVFSFENIVSSKMFEPVYARIYIRTGNTYRYGDIDKYSVKDYAANQIEKNSDVKLIKLLRSLLLYGDEAEKYFRLNR